MKKSLRIIHCVPDEKFIDGLIKLTQTLWVDCYHEYAFVNNNPYVNFKYIKNQEAIKRFGVRQINEYVRKSKFNVVVIHNLQSIPFCDLVDIPEGVKVVWFAWGFDIYYPTYQTLRPLIKRDLFYKKTKLALRSGIASWKYSFHQTISRAMGYRYYWKMKKAISRIDYFSGVIPEEYKMILEDKHNKHFRAQPLLFKYNSLRNSFCEEDLHKPVISGFDIQIGNSGDPTNNHIDMIDMLRLLNLREKKIYCPISYSGPEFYHKIVKGYGKKLFAERFIALTTFLPLEEYKKILASTRYAIFAMERQQALGNVFAGMWEGRMVFLSETNPAYISLKKRGYVLYTIQHDLDRIERNEIMKEEDVLKNRKLLIKSYSIETERKNSQNIINTLKESLNNV